MKSDKQYYQPITLKMIVDNQTEFIQTHKHKTKM